jgi:hypothetical protein
MTRHTGITRVRPDHGEPRTPRPDASDYSPTHKESAELSKLIAERWQRTR